MRIQSNRKNSFFWTKVAAALILLYTIFSGWQWLTAEAGLPAGAGGTFTAGGTQSNYMGLLLARDAFLKSRFHWLAQKRGLPPEAARMRVLCSEVAHFTVEKSVVQLGLGTDAVVRVSVDDEFRIVARIDMVLQRQAIRPDGEPFSS